MSVELDYSQLPSWFQYPCCGSPVVSVRDFRFTFLRKEKMILQSHGFKTIHVLDFFSACSAFAARVSKLCSRNSLHHWLSEKPYIMIFEFYVLRTVDPPYNALFARNVLYIKESFSLVHLQQFDLLSSQ